MRILLLLFLFCGTVGAEVPYVTGNTSTDENFIYYDSGIKKLSTNLTDNYVALAGSPTFTGSVTFLGQVSISTTPTVAGAAFLADNQTFSGVNTFSQNILGNLTGNVTGNVSGSAGSATGNAATSTSLSADPTDCTLPNVALGINASGTAQCSQPSNVTGNAATATNVAASGVLAGNLGSGVIASSIAVGAINNSNQIADGTIIGPDIAASTVSLNKFNQSGCALNDVVKWDGSKWDCGLDVGDVDTVTDFKYEDWSSEANGVTTQFTFDFEPSTHSVILVKNGIVLSPVYDYTMHTTSVTFLTAPVTGTTLIAKYGVSAVAISVLRSSNVWTANQYFNVTKIGIGTTNPGEKLEVSGNIKLSGKVVNVSTATDNADAVNGSMMTFKRIFTTSVGYSPNMGGASGANSNCQTRANAASLGGTWIALLCTSAVNANTLPTYNSINVYRRLDGNIVSSAIHIGTLNDLWKGSINVPLNIDENGSVVSGAVWTGCSSAGAGSGNYCPNVGGTSWSGTLSGYSGTYGNASAADSTWISWGSIACDHFSNPTYKLYCIEQ